MHKAPQKRSAMKPKVAKKAPKAQRKVAKKITKTPLRTFSTSPKLRPQQPMKSKFAPMMTPKRFMSHSLSQHIDKPYNNADTKFEFTPESMEKIKTVLKKFPENYKQSAVMPVLFIAQEQNDNWLPLVAMDKIAELLDMPKMRVYEVATFYTMYNRDKVGKFHIQVCGTTTCLTMGARDIKKAAKKFAGVSHDGEVSKDGNFCIVEVECLGFCSNAPGVQVNNHEVYENLTPESMVNVMKGLLTGTAKVGPQNGQRCAEGPQGPSTLRGFSESFPKFNLERIDTKLAEMKAAAAVPPTTAAPAAAAAPVAPKVEEKKEAVKAAEAPKPTAPTPPTSKVEEKKAEAPKVEAPKVEAPKAAEAKKAEAPKAAEAKKATEKKATEKK